MSRTATRRRKQSRSSLDPSLEYHAFTWIDDDWLALLTKDSLVSLRLDSSTLERRGSLEPIVRLSGLEVMG